jgi:hypothetical protein
MSLQRRFRKTLGVLGLALTVSGSAFSQTIYATQGVEYAPAGLMPGDQIHPSLALSPGGGWLVFDDNITDGDGQGISAQQLSSSFSPQFGVIRVNKQGAGDQEKPRVSLLKNGGAAFVWQGGPQSFQHIYAGLLTASNTWVFPTNDVMVNTTTNKYQQDPTIATLTNGNVIVAWGSVGQDNLAVNQKALQGVYAQILTPTGTKVGAEFQVNTFTIGSQRTPSVAVFPNGNFVITWVSEQERFTNSVDIYARLFNSSGAALGNEFLVNTGTNICANPSVTVASDNTFMVAWGEKDLIVPNNSWDVFSRPFSAAGNGGTAVRVNSQQFGDQYVPNLSAIGTDYLAVWTSLGQDGSREGVFGQVLHADASHAGGEFRVNTTILNAQEFPAVASDGAGRFLVAWSSYTGGLNSLDLNAQRYATVLDPLSAPAKPFVTAVSSSRLTVSWPPLAGFSISNYGVYVDGSATPISVTNTYWSMAGLPPSATHSFILDYLLTDGRRSPQSSPAASGTTWGADDNFDGLPDDWQAQFWGGSPPPPGTLLAPGVSILNVFLWGGNPLDASTWLKTWSSKTPQGYFFNWNTVPGSIYQVEVSTNPGSPASWTSVGPLRFAAGTTDAIFVGQATTLQVYRVKRIRF